MVPDELEPTVPLDPGRPIPAASPARAERGAPMLAAGELLAGRFRIESYLARGGMGEVYDALDATLGRRVALKTIRPEIARDADSMRRFRHEVLHATRVTHPNVCRIYDIGTEPARGDRGEIAFLTMELLDGETLGQRIRRAGPLPAEEALPIVRQVAAALDAAHDAGIIHRDLKSDNVFLVPRSDEPGGVRAVVTDFGLAHGGEGEAASGSITGGGALVGSPDYMSPEQVRGESLGPESDVYALGVVLYEAMTGTLPFRADTPLGTAVKRLTDPPPRPSVRMPSIDPRWERVILRCLERDKAARFARASDVARALEGEAIVGATRRGRGPLAAAAAILLVTALSIALWPRRPPRPPAATSGGRRSVAVLGFKNVTGRPDERWVGTALSEMLATELQAGEKLRAIPGESVARVKSDLALPEADTLAADTLARLHQTLGADLIVVGSYVVVGSPPAAQIRLDLKLQDARAGEIIVAASESGREEELFDLVSRLGNRLRAKLGVESPAATAVAAARRSFPSDPRAAKLFAEALARQRAYDTVGAEELLEKVVTLVPGLALAHAALSKCQGDLGQPAKAAEEARLAFQLSRDLPRAERLFIEGRYRSRTGDKEGAITAFRDLFDFYPDDLEYGLELAMAQADAAKLADAEATLEKLRKLSEPAGDDPRIDLQAAAMAMGSDRATARKLAAAAADGAMARGLRHLAARARQWEGAALLRLADPRGALLTFEEARRIYADLGDRLGLAGTLNEMINLLASKQDYEGAAPLIDECLGTYRDLGDAGAPGIARTLQQRVSALTWLGRTAEARLAADEAVSIYCRLDDPEGAAEVHSDLSDAFTVSGDLAGARRELEEALALVRQARQSRFEASYLVQLGEVLRRGGDYEGAKARLLEALPISRASADRGQEASVQYGLAFVAENQGNLEEARSRYLEAANVDEGAGNRRRQAGDLTQAASVSRRMGEVAQARSMFVKALGIMRQAQSVQGEALTLAFFAILQESLGELSDARASIDKAAEALIRIKDPNIDFASLHRIRILLDMGDVASALAAADEMAATAEWHGAVARADAAQLRARVMLQRGDVEGAAAALEEPGGAEPDKVLLRAEVALCRRDVDAARKLWQQALRSSEGAPWQRGALLLEVAAIAAAARDSRAVRALCDDATRQSPQDRSLAIWALALRADAALEVGDRDSCRADATKLLEQARAIGLRPYVCDALELLGRVGVARGDREAARRSFEEALDVANGMGAAPRAATLESRLADLASSDGRPEEGERLARSAIARLQDDAPIEAGARARLALARALEQQGKVDEAKPERTRGLDLASRCGRAELWARIRR